jgi:hypothetical protein
VDLLLEEDQLSRLDAIDCAYCIDLQQYYEAKQDLNLARGEVRKAMHASPQVRARLYARISSDFLLMRSLARLSCHHHFVPSISIS